MDFKDTVAQILFNEASALEEHVAVKNAELDRSKAQNTTNKTLLEGVWNALTLHEKESPLRLSNYLNKREKLTAKQASLDVALQKCCTDSDIKVLCLQATLKSEMKCAEEDGKERKRLSVVHNGLKAPLRD